MPAGTPSATHSCDAGFRIARCRAAGIARRIEQVEALGREQLHDVGRTDRTLVSATQADVRNRRPLEAKLVRVGLHAVTVVRVTVGGVEGEALRERLVLCDRDPGFHEEFLDRRGAADTDHRAAGARELVGRLERVDLLRSASRRYSEPNTTWMPSVASGDLIP